MFNSACNYVLYISGLVHWKHALWTWALFWQIVIPLPDHLWAMLRNELFTRCPGSMQILAHGVKKNANSDLKILTVPWSRHIKMRREHNSFTQLSHPLDECMTWRTVSLLCFALLGFLGFRLLGIKLLNPRARNEDHFLWFLTSPALTKPISFYNSVCETLHNVFMLIGKRHLNIIMMSVPA